LSRPAPARRTASSGLSGALAGTLVATQLAAFAVAAVPSGPVLQAVVSYDGRLASAPGVRVLTTLPSLRIAVVRGDAASLRRLSTAPGVRGVAPDDAVQLSGDSGNSDSSDDSDNRGGVVASAGLGGKAGRPGAGAGVTVAVVDTGVSDTPALNRSSGRLRDAADSSKVGDGGRVETGGTYVDGYGHGTFMAGVVAGGPVRGLDGRALGVAPGATVLVVRVAKQDGSTSLSRVLGGLDWIVGHAHDVDIVNLSLSHTRPHDSYGADPLTDAVEKVRDAGVSVVVSAGNTKNIVSDPGFDPRVLTVGAFDTGRGKVASFSGSGVVAGVAKPDVVASGVDVLGVLPAGSVLARAKGTTHLANGLFRGSGTSQATAITSGLAALFLAAHPSATPVQVKASLRCAATDLKGRRDGGGLVRTTTTLCAGTDGQALDGSGDASGEAGFDASSWAASSWAASSWAASAWAASAWAASAWGGADWGGDG
jgi:serine protease AprX